MTRYTVTWLRDARNALADVWVQATDKQAVTQAADQIDRELAVNAESKGMEVSEGLRLFSVSPLCAFFTVSEADRVVEVVRLRLDFPREEANGGVPTNPGPPSP